MKNTPGPWNIKTPTDFVGPFQHIVDNTGFMIANINHTDNGPMLNMERRANAHLISAAPEMLEALCSIYYMANLEPLLRTKYSAETVRIIMTQMDNAIKKARGE